MNAAAIVRGSVIAVALSFPVNTARADEGMWLFTRPPVHILKAQYSFEPSAQWLEHLQKSSVRFSSGGSGSIISADGLVMTNHHVGSDDLANLSTPERDLLETGFYAKTLEEELKCKDLELLVLWTIEDVTQQVRGAEQPEMSPADANTARRKMMATIEAEAEAKTKLDCQVVTLYQGAMYHLYSYKRYTDIRLVMAPEHQIAFFGGDNDNFEFPRYDLDMCFFRIYEDGKPLKPEHFLKWGDGADEGELVFVSGHPGSTQRLNTMDHVRFLRDVDLPATLHRLWRREVQTTTFANRSAENRRIAGEDLAGVQNSRKAETGLMAGLLDPAIMAKKNEEEAKLRAAVESNSDHRAKWGGAWEQIGAAEQKYRGFYARYQLLEGRGRALRSDLFTAAKQIVRHADEQQKANADRLPEFRDTELDSLFLELYSDAPIYDELEIFRLSSGLSYLAEMLGADDPLVKLALGGSSPQQRAADLVQKTALKDIEARRKLVEGGKRAVDASSDPIIQLAAALDPELRVLRTKFEDEVESAEREGYARIAAARFEAFGEDEYPDATFTLRLAFGAVKGYQETGSNVPAFTTLGGAYERAKERHFDPDTQLTRRWLERKDKLKLDTPYNFVCTADIIGGNSGSPVVDKNGEVVGLIFDGNLHSLVLDVIYSDVQARAVAVDSRAIIECLRKLYDAAPLADEITSGHRK